MTQGDIYSFGEIWPDWRICEQLDKGSFGRVYRAERNDMTGIRRVAAVKHITIPGREAGDEQAVISPEERREMARKELQTLINEIDMMVRLHGHRNIVGYEEHRVIASPDGLRFDLFLRMELLTSLKTYLKEKSGELNREMAIRIGLDLAEALKTMHDLNLIHRDLKPANVFVDDRGNFKLGDFGTARVLSADHMASTHVGTVNYMAPEVSHMGVYYDRTVDFYSLGIMLYYVMNNGRLPFEKKGVDKETAVIRRMRGDALECPCNADPSLAQVILKCCAYQPQERYQTADQLMEDLKLCRDTGKPVPEPDVPVQAEPEAPIDRPRTKLQEAMQVPPGWSPIQQIAQGLNPEPKVSPVSQNYTGHWGSGTNGNDGDESPWKKKTPLCQNLPPEDEYENTRAMA